jgi:hypothetical protein
VSEEKPLDCGRWSMPEPDLAVVRASERPSFRHRHPRGDETLPMAEIALTVTDVLG